MSKILFIIIFLFLNIIIVAMGIYFSGLIMVINHEDVHKEIFAEYGINSTIKIDHFRLSGVTYALDNGSCNDYCKLANNQNEIVGYQLMGFGQQIWIMWMVTVFMVIALFLAREIL